MRNLEFLYIRNTCNSTIEIGLQNLQDSVQAYLQPGHVKRVGEGRIVILRSPEEIVLTFFLQNISEECRLDLYRVSSSQTVRQRSLLPGRTRNIRLDGSDGLVVVPVGKLED